MEFRKLREDIRSLAFITGSGGQPIISESNPFDEGFIQELHPPFNRGSPWFEKGSTDRVSQRGVSALFGGTTRH